jgi:hypothetical protein
MIEVKQDRGVLYVATGPSHIRAALRSARTVRDTNPSLPIHLFADSTAHGFNFSAESGPLTSWAEIADPHSRSKVDYMVRTPFARTLYLDTDTRVLCGLNDLFGLLDRFDVALAHAHRRGGATRQEGWVSRIPEAFPMFNSGVILYNLNAETMPFFETWQQSYHAAGLLHDQETLREVLWSAGLRIATLPPEYNVRYLKYLLVWTKDEARPRILHLPHYRQGILVYARRWAGRWKRRINRRLGWRG